MVEEGRSLHESTKILQITLGFGGKRSLRSFSILSGSSTYGLGKKEVKEGERKKVKKKEKNHGPYFDCYDCYMGLYDHFFENISDTDQSSHVFCNLRYKSVTGFFYNHGSPACSEIGIESCD